MSQKINVGVLFGGKSAEHEVSLRSAKNVVEAMDKEKYNPVLILIDKAGKWFFSDQNLQNTGKEVALVPQGEGNIIEILKGEVAERVDVVFPVLHGTFGEDGTVQGLLKLAGVPFVGAGVLGSAVGMDKDAMKRLLRDAGLPTAKFLVYRNPIAVNFDDVAREVSVPFFVKPANLGSSVGVHKVHNEAEFANAVEDAFQYDTKIIIEEFIEGREIECSVLGNENPIASLPGEVIPTHEFYSYEAKYLDENGATFGIPAKLPEDTVKEVQRLAIETFKALCCEGMGRVDCFLLPDGRVVVNEINTIPGFTSISMYPKLWEASGIGYTELIDKLIQLALERFGKEQKLKTSYSL